MRDVNDALVKRGLQQLPLHLYRYARKNFSLSKFRENGAVDDRVIAIKQDNKFSKLIFQRGNKHSSSKQLTNFVKKSTRTKLALKNSNSDIFKRTLKPKYNPLNHEM